MKFKILNHSNLNMDQARPFLKSFLPFAKKKMGFDRPVSVIFKSDSDNATQVLGKTAFYDPNRDSVTVYTDGRHLKDILRSLSHELVHHTQNCRGDLNHTSGHGEDYFQYDKYMQEMEREAYEKGNMTFRDWEEKHKKQLKESNYYTGVHKMKRIDSRRNNLNNLLMERFGYKSKQNEDISHLCATLVTEKSTGRVGHPINHTLLEDGTVTHYDVEFDAKDEDEVMEEEKMPDKNKDGIPDFAQDGKGKNDLGKAKGAEDPEDDSEDDSKKDKDLSKVPPQLRKHVAKKKANEAMIREAIRKALRGV